jgi:hypothetical protein
MPRRHQNFVFGLYFISNLRAFFFNLRWKPLLEFWCMWMKAVFWKNPVQSCWWALEFELVNDILQTLNAMLVTPKKPVMNSLNLMKWKLWRSARCIPTCTTICVLLEPFRRCGLSYFDSFSSSSGRPSCSLNWRSESWSFWSAMFNPIWVTRMGHSNTDLQVHMTFKRIEVW